MARVLFHLDMDAFFASVEQRDNPALAGKPVIVGAPPDRRGVVSAASYEARAFGVHSAMPSRTAYRLCPGGAFVSPRMTAYRDVSRQIMARLAGYADAIEPMSIDEAYLEMSSRFQDLPPDDAIRAAMDLGREIKETIRREHRLNASIGIATNKLLAKIASDYGKPDGLFCITESEKKAFLRPLPASAIHGVGKVTAEVLTKAGLRTIGDIQDHPGDLRALVGSFGAALKRYASGEDDRALEVEGEVKSISVEDTFERDTEDRRILVPTLKAQAEEIARKLSREQLAAKTVQVKVRYSDFKTLTRQISIEDPVEDAETLYLLACSLLRRDRLVTRPLRLLGLGVSRMVPPAAQLMLPF
ncbi:MAG: DNA polymerase IV [Chthoniobacteraceae bacterium]